MRRGKIITDSNESSAPKAPIWDSEADSCEKDSFVSWEVLASETRELKLKPIRVDLESSLNVASQREVIFIESSSEDFKQADCFLFHEES